MFIRYFTLALAATTALSTPTLAQTEAAPAATDSTGISDIVVTARKTAERAQDVPVSLSVSTGQDLANRSVQTFIDIQRQTPSLHILPSALSATTTNISMRGQSLPDIRLNIDPAVVIYQDGVPLPRSVGSNAADLLDIDRVEVLAGPQGTLYGKNSTGGAINIFTKDPVGQFEGFVKGRIGSYLDSQIAGMVNAPVSDVVAIRLLGAYTHSDGAGRNVVDGTRAGERDSKMFRAAVKYSPTDQFTMIIRGDFTHTKMNREPFKGLAFLNPVTASAASCTFNASGVPTGGFGGPTGTLEAALERNGLANTTAFCAQDQATRNAQLVAADALLRTYVGGNLNDAAVDQASGETARVWGVSGQLEYAFNDDISVKSLTAMRGFTRRSTMDLDGTPFTLLQYPFQYTSDRQFSEEAQLNVRAFDKRLNWITGVFFSNEKGTERVDQTALRLISGAGATTTSDAAVQNKSFGVFSQATFKLTDQFSATGGIRYSKDDRSVTTHNYTATFCNSLGLSLASVGGIGGCSRPTTASFDKISYTASLDYHLNRDIMVYAKTSRGYRSGGLQQAISGATPAIANAAFQPFQPEVVTDYEAGIKSELFDRHLRVNVAYYHSKLKNAIRSTSTPTPDENGVVRSVSRAQNAATAQVDGIEWDVTAIPVNGLELNVNGAWTDARFIKYITPTGADLSFLPLLFTPKWQVGASAAYTADVGIGDWRTQVDMSYTGRQLTSEPGAYSPAHTIWNARTSLDIKSADVNLAVYVRNIADKRYLAYPVDLTSAFGFMYGGIYNPPRTFGFEVTKKF